MIVKDYRILKILFTILGIYLIAEECYIFIVLKPTYTSHERREMSAEDFPEIMFCPEPSINNTVLISKGYVGPEQYFKGFKKDSYFKYVNWGGKEIKDIKKVTTAISMLKSKTEKIMNLHQKVLQNIKYDLNFKILSNSLTTL